MQCFGYPKQHSDTLPCSETGTGGRSSQGSGDMRHPMRSPFLLYNLPFHLYIEIDKHSAHRRRMHNALRPEPAETQKIGPVTLKGYPRHHEY